MSIKRKSIICLLMATLLMTSTMSVQALTLESKSYSELTIMTDAEMWQIEGGGWINRAALWVKGSFCKLWSGLKATWDQVLSSLPKVEACIKIRKYEEIVGESPNGPFTFYQSISDVNIALSFEWSGASCGIGSDSNTATQYND